MLDDFPAINSIIYTTRKGDNGKVACASVVQAILPRLPRNPMLVKTYSDDDPFVAIFEWVESDGHPTKLKRLECNKTTKILEEVK